MGKPAEPQHAEKPLVGIIMGSESDHETLRRAEEILARLEIPYELAVVSAHRTPLRMVEWAQGAAGRGIKVVIAGAGGAAHLPGMVSSLTPLPVLGVPVESKVLRGVDSLLSIVQMPAGVPTATFAIGPSGAANAALFAARILAVEDAALRAKVEAYRVENEQSVLASDERVKKARVGR